MDIKNYLQQLDKRHLIVLILLTICGFFLRFYHLGYNSFWEDEMATLKFIGYDLIGIWNIMLFDTRPTPPLFYVLNHYMLFFGDSEFVLRFLSAFFGSLTIPLVYLIGKNLVNKCGGMVAAALLTVSIFHIYYSQEARAYALLLFIFSIAVLFYVYAINSDKTKYWIGFSAFSALAFWCHFYILIGIGILFLHALILKGKDILHDIKNVYHILLSFGLFIILVSPLIVIGLSIMSEQLAPIQPGLTGIFTVPFAVYKMLTWNYTTITIINCLVTGIYCLAALFGIFHINKKNKSNSLLIILGCVPPLIFSILLSSFFGLAVWQQYLIFVLPFILIGISGLVYLIPKKFESTKMSVVLVSCILLLSMAYLPAYYTTETKSDWKGASEGLAALTDDGDIIVHLGAGDRIYHYYDPVANHVTAITINSTEELDALASDIDGESVYFVVTWALSPKNIPEIAPSGSAYIDSLISNYYADTALDAGDNEIIEWLNNNTVECSKYSYYGPYRDIQIRKFV